MSGSLSHSPAVIVARLLIALGHGVDPVADSPNLNWQVYETGEPDKPDNCVTVYDTEGVSHGREMVTGERQEHEGVQVRVRGRTHEVGFLKAHQIAQALDRDVQNLIVSINGTNYLVEAITRQGSVLAIGKESPTSNRRLFTINALIAVTRN